MGWWLGGFWWDLQGCATTRRTLISPFYAGFNIHCLYNIRLICIKEIFLYNLCRLDGVKVHGLTVLLAPLLPMVREARVLQAGEGRLNITLEGVASNTLVHILALLSTGIGIDSKPYSDCFIRNH